jgi:hypothetical protein
MRLYNQTKNQLGWSLGGKKLEAEPWGPVDIPDALAAAVRKMGLPLGIAPVAPEHRALVRVADEQAAAAAEPLRVLKAAADAAQAGERAAKEELERMSVELGSVRGELRQARESITDLKGRLKQALADKGAAEALLSETAANAEASEARAIKAEAMRGEKPAQPKAKRAE